MLLFEQTFCPPCLCLYSSSTAVAASAAATVDVRNRGKGRERQFTEIDDDNNNRLGEEKCVQESERLLFPPPLCNIISTIIAGGVGSQWRRLAAYS